MTLHVTISPGRTARLALWGLLLLLLAHGAATILRLNGFEYIFGLVPLFDFDREGNFPTFYATVLLLACSAILVAVAAWRRRLGGRHHRYWAGLAAIFLFLGLDEILVLHEKFSQLETVMPSDGAFHFPWVVVYGPMVLLIGLLYLRFLAALPRATMTRFVLAGALYVGGAIGMELIGAPMWAAGTEGGALYALVSTLEELFEFLGVIVFLHAVLAYVERSAEPLDVLLSLGSTGVARASAPAR